MSHGDYMKGQNTREKFVFYYIFDEEVDSCGDVWLVYTTMVSNKLGYKS